MRILSIFLISFVLLVNFSNAKEHLFSTLPLPKMEILNVEIDKCDMSCMEQLYQEGKIFSYIAEFDMATNDDSVLKSYFDEILQKLGIIESNKTIQPATPSKTKKTNKPEVRVALIMPKKIVGRYSTQSTYTILSYLAAKGNPFVFEVFDTIDEDIYNISEAYNKAKNEGYDFAIGIFTLNAANKIASDLDVSMPLFLPTINIFQLNQDLLANMSKNLYFGGIDYQSQIKLILSLNKNTPLVVFNDESFVGRNLGKITKNTASHIIYEESINRKKAAGFGKDIDKYGRIIADRSVLFNTPIINSGLIISQFSLSKEKPKMLLSTQLNYNPALLMLVKEERERENFFVVSSISSVDNAVTEYASLLGGDLKYDWVNYSMAVGTENMFMKIFDDEDRYFQEKMKDNQIKYINKIYRATQKGFTPM